MDNPYKLATYATQDNEIQNKETTQYALVTTIRKQTPIKQIQQTGRIDEQDNTKRRK